VQKKWGSILRLNGWVIFVAFLVVVGLTLAPIARFWVQREGLDNDLGMIMMELNTARRSGFEHRIRGICEDSRLEPEDYEFTISEDKKNNRVSVEIRYQVEFRILLVPIARDVTIRKEIDIYE
jgi:hypothetical protein